jgi:uncharacterized membrane protein YfcA
VLTLFLLAAFAGAVASVTGFGIGSILTPFIAIASGTPLAVAAVALPHAAASALRFAMLWRAVAWRVLLTFGLASAVGALIGALLQPVFGARGLTLVLGVLLVVTAIATLTGWLERRDVGRIGAIALGALSGIFGGLVGNQGGVRSGALLAFRLDPRAFVATATASALLVDLARTPVYFIRARGDLAPVATEIGVMTAGVLLGTILGERALRRIPRELFRKVVAAGVGAIGVWLITTAISD